MAALTWRNVDAPNLAPALAGMQQFSQLLGQAFGGATAALDVYDETKSEKVNNLLALEIAAAQDPEAAKALALGLASRPDAARIDPATAALANRRQQEIQDLAYRGLQTKDLEGDVAFEGIERARTQEDWKNLDAAKPVAALLLDAQNEAEADKIWKDNAAIVSKLAPDAQLALRRAPLSVINDELSLVGARLDNTGKGIDNETATFNLQRGRWEHNNAVVDRQAEEAGMAVASTVMSQARSGEEALLSLLPKSTVGGHAQRAVVNGKAPWAH